MSITRSYYDSRHSLERCAGTPPLHMRTALAAAKILYRAGKAAYKSRKATTVTRRSPSRIVVSRQVPRGVYKTVKIEQAVLVGH